MAWNQIADLTGPPGSTTIRGTTDYDDTTAPTDRQAILWVAAGGKYKPQTIQLADVSGLVSGLAEKQAADADLTAFAALAPANDDVVQRKAGAWTNRTPAQLKADLALAYGDITGTVPTAALPPLAINETFTVGSQAAMLALTAQRGDIAIRTDTGLTYVLSTDSPGTLADWKEVMAAGQVTSVAGRNGAVVLVKGDVGLGNVDNTADTAKPVSTAQQAALDGKQPLDADLTTIAGLTATTDSVMQAKAGAWSARTLAQLKTDLSVQPLDADLTTIAGLTAATDSFMQAKAGAWASRTIAQVKTDLAIDQLDNTTDLNKPVSTATTTAIAAAGNIRSLATRVVTTVGTIHTGITTTEVNVAKLAITPVAITSGRWYEFVVSLGTQFSSALDSFTVRIRQTTALTGAVVANWSWIAQVAGYTHSNTLVVPWKATATAGASAFYVSVQRVAGSGNAEVNGDRTTAFQIREFTSATNLTEVA